MTPSDFYDITSHHIAGPNKDPRKAERMRTFLIPDRFTVPGSSTSSRTIKIFAAFISPEWVYVLSDFSGLVRMHLRSKKSPWTERDLHPRSDVSSLYAWCIKLFIYLICCSTGTDFLKPSKVGRIGCLSAPSLCQRFNNGDRLFLKNIANGKFGLENWRRPTRKS